ncbi:hypothetical protein ACTMTI_37905 [Nonomuraea sp. H19]|uniref:hypothetical protein n=1 Tax=Nonomuraea sp. H19 TaxID=3452206 RepID=UPI003F8BEB6A
MTDTMLAVAACVASSLCYAQGAIAQRRIAMAGREGRAGWAYALGMNLAGGALHVVALVFGPVTMVQPLGALTLVVAVWLRRRTAVVTRMEWIGAALTVLALAGLVWLTLPVAASRALTGTEMVTVSVVSAAALATLTAGALAPARVIRSAAWSGSAGVAFGTTPARVIRSAAWAGSAGVAFGTASALVPAVAGAGGEGMLLVGAVVGCFAVAGTALSQASYRDFGLALPLAVQNVANPLAAAAIGITVLGEQFRPGTVGLAAVAAAGLVCGVVLLARGEQARTGSASEVPLTPPIGSSPEVPLSSAPQVRLSSAPVGGRPSVWPVTSPPIGSRS